MVALPPNRFDRYRLAQKPKEHQLPRPLNRAARKSQRPSRLAHLRQYQGKPSMAEASVFEITYTGL